MYGQLPSYILAHATVYDLVVADALAEYEQRLANPGMAPKAPKLSQEEMRNMIKAARSEK